MYIQYRYLISKGPSTCSILISGCFAGLAASYS